jgi:hypothetical protein
MPATPRLVAAEVVQYAASMMCGCIPISAVPVATVRRISCKRQAGIGRAFLPNAFRRASQKANLHRRSRFGVWPEPAKLRCGLATIQHAKVRVDGASAPAPGKPIAVARVRITESGREALRADIHVVQFFGTCSNFTCRGARRGEMTAPRNRRRARPLAGAAHHVQSDQGATGPVPSPDNDAPCRRTPGPRHAHEPGT